jgi:hypothetical protein
MLQLLLLFRLAGGLLHYPAWQNQHLLLLLLLLVVVVLPLAEPASWQQHWLLQLLLLRSQSPCHQHCQQALPLLQLPLLLLH